MVEKRLSQHMQTVEARGGRLMRLVLKLAPGMEIILAYAPRAGKDD